MNTLTVTKSSAARTDSQGGQAVCDCCGSSDSTFIATKRSYKLRRCNNCDLVFVYPQPKPEHLAGIYNKTAGYFATADTDLSKTSPSYASYLHKMLLANGIKTKQLLDVGCSTGSLMYHMHHLGWEVTGTEINPDAAAVASDNGLDVVLGELESCPFDEDSFDLVHLSDVIEHVRSPRQTLLAAHHLLREGGLIVIKTTNAKCGFAVSSFMLTKIFGFPWPHSEAPYHLYDFCPQTLSQLVSNAGFEVISVNCCGHMPFLYTIGATGFFDELKASMKRRGKYRFNMRLLINVPKLTIVAAILLPFYIWGRISDSLLRTGSRMTVLACRI